METLWQHIVADFAAIGTPAALAAFAQVVLIDVLLAADNAIVVGALAAGLPPAMRRKVILVGVVAALVLRIGFALVVTQLLQVVGLVLAGGLLLVWVAWKMWRELRGGYGDDDALAHQAPRRFWAAAWAVAVADISMSLDNVLAVAGAARDHPGILAIGLILSVALMGLAANILARVIERYRWLAYVGLLVILWVAGKMIWEGLTDPARGLLTCSPDPSHPTPPYRERLP
ncbi:MULTISPECIES: YjbE family putative metal transport protein [unclassified Sphingomonas]|uniref:YjbE family putative metal transport protein n=1 Tax=unclassified Sphingomonas TaxID=196159 RepID=UPI0028649A45|nr:MULTISPECIES: YjbE family putative metal transport protein [unclassified Sphingomonas]MDR6116358.1 YjbE family integral membrane protein [Sphingomonas sp. SORGH_AS_0789]MDR6149967.1 YjbE family integral membrane protein [Sphingomonas sp. SORGH_AS_0742]